MSRSLVRSAAALVALSLTASCNLEPSGEQAMSPPSFYREWWARTEACSGLTGNFDKVQWFVVPGHGFDCPSGKCAGRWESGHRIYLSADFDTNELVVRHEMLHELIGRPGHPDPPFGSECPLTWNSFQGNIGALEADRRAADTVHVD